MEKENLKNYDAPELMRLEIETEIGYCASPGSLKPGESEDGELGDDL